MEFASANKEVHAEQAPKHTYHQKHGSRLAQVGVHEELLAPSFFNDGGCHDRAQN